MLESSAAVVRCQQTLDLLHLVVRQFNHPLDSNTKLARSPSIHIHRTDGMPVRKGHIPTRRLPFTPKLNRADVPGRDGAARQRALVGNSYDDQERTDHLFEKAVR